MTSSNSSSCPASLKNFFPGASNTYNSMKCKLADKDIIVSSSDDDGGGKLVIVERRVSPVLSSRHYIPAILACGGLIEENSCFLVINDGDKGGGFEVQPE